MNLRNKLFIPFLVPGLLLAVAAMSPSPASAQSRAPANAGESVKPPSADKTSRKHMQIVGSSSLHESLTPAVIKVFTDTFKVETPVVKSTGTSAGIKEFCAGVGPEYPDVVAASRKMRNSEYQSCVENGVVDIIEVKLGASPVLVMTKKNHPSFDVTPRMIYLASADTLPVDEDFDENTYKKWREIDGNAPDKFIKIIIPDTASGTRGFINDRFLEGGCRHYKGIDNIFSASERVRQCTTIRSDGVVVELPEPYGAAMIRELTKPDNDVVGVAIAGELTYIAHQDKLKLLSSHGYLPTKENVNSGKYQLVAFPRYYFKRGHMRNNKGEGVVRGLRELIGIVSSEKMVGPDGIFDNLGLIPLDDRERERMRTDALRLKSINQ